MKLSVIFRTFNPLFFQASLAAGGVALMAFNYLQFDVPHGPGPVRLSDVVWSSLQGSQLPLYGFLIAVMFAAVVVHIALTIIFLGGLFSWLTDRKAVSSLFEDPYRNVTIFPVIGSLAMSANVVWAPIGFFVPWVALGLQALMLPSLVLFAILFISLFYLEFRVLKVWLKGAFDTTKFNFVWLLDVFAFGLVALTGSGIAVIAQDRTISAMGGVGAVITLLVGLILLVIKIFYLVRNQIRAKKLPDAPVLPAFFLVVPILCLFGLSIYRIPSEFQALFSVDLTGISSFVIALSYVAAIGWVLVAVILLGNYFRSQFMRSNYSAPQWGMV